MTLYTTLEALTEPSREVDAEIYALTPSGSQLTQHKRAEIAPAYTSDLNAVIELIEREVGPVWDMLRDEDGCWGALWSPSDYRARHTLPAVALLMAFFKARGEG